VSSFVATYARAVHAETLVQWVEQAAA